MIIKFLTLLIALFSSALGVGGGALLVPLLHSIAKLEFKKATCTSIALIVPISYIGMILHLLLKYSSIPWEIVPFFIISCVFGPLLSKYFIGKLNNNFIKFIFSTFLLIFALKLLNYFDLFTFILRDNSTLASYIQSNLKLIVFFYGLLISTASVSFGVGGGLITVPFLHLVCGVPIAHSIAISLISVAIISTFGSLILKKTSHFENGLFKKLFPYCIAGSILGALVSQITPDTYLKKMFALLILFVGIRYLYLIARDFKMSLKQVTINNQGNL